MQDTLDENDETVIVDIASISGGGATENGTQSVTTTITDDDAPPTLSIADASLAEGNSGISNMTFTVTLDAASGKAVTVNYATSNGTATAGSDYTAASGTLTFAPGATTQTVTVAVQGDTTSESNETFTVTLSGPTNATIATASATGTISNDDNAPPVATTSGGATAFTEGSNVTSTPVAVDSGLTVSDADNATLASATVSITGNFHAAEDMLAFTNNPATMGNISASYVAGTGVLTLSSAGATATLAQWQAALRSVSYTNSSDAPDTANRTISFMVNDGDTNSSTVTKTVSVTAVNDSPLVTSSGGTTAFTEGSNVPSTPVAVDSGLTVSDADNATLASATVSITGIFHAAEDMLAFTNNPATMGNISASYVAGTGVLTLSSAGATATLAQWQAALRSVSYTNSSDVPDTANRTISFVVNDGSTNSSAVTKTVSVTAVNDSPLVTSSGGTTAFTEGSNVPSTPVAVDSGLTVSDADNATLASATVSITGNFHAAEDMLAFTNNPATMGNISASYVAGTGVLTLSSAGATATLAQWQAALRSVSYTNSSDAPDTANRTISFVVNDGSTNSSAVTKTVSVTAVNDSPTLSTFVAVDTTFVNTTVEITLAELKTKGNEADTDGTVDAFVVKAVSTGTLKIGSSAASATIWVAGINDKVDATHQAYWTGDANVTGTLNAFTAVALDNSNFESATAQQVTVTVAAVPVPVPVRSIAFSTMTFAEAAINDGSITTTSTITLTNDSFTGVNGADLGVVSHVPMGLTAHLVKFDSTHATLSFAGNAAAHANANDIVNLTVAFGDADFTGHSAATVTGATTSNLIVDFADPAVPPNGGDSTDTDHDQFPDHLEAANGLSVGVKDNDVFGSSKLFAMQLYRDVLYREGESDGLQFWQAQIDSGHMSRAEVAASFLDSSEFQTGAGIARLYFGALQRMPDPEGLDHWLGQSHSGSSLSQIGEAFAASPEFISTYGNLDNTAFVDQLYQNILGRGADTAGKDFWISYLESGASRGTVVTGFTESAEGKLALQTKVDVALDYVGLLGRAPDQQGFDDWVQQHDSGMPEISIIGSFIACPEYHDRFLA